MMHGDKLVGIHRLAAIAEKLHNHHALPKGNSTRVILCNCMPIIKIGQRLKFCSMAYGQKSVERSAYRVYKHRKLSKRFREGMNTPD